MTLDESVGVGARGSLTVSFDMANGESLHICDRNTDDAVWIVKQVQAVWDGKRDRPSWLVLHTGTDGTARCVNLRQIVAVNASSEVWEGSTR